MPLAESVTAFLIHDGRVLVLRRRDQARGGCWASVNGDLEQSPLDQAYAELRAAIGLDRDDVELVTQGEPMHVLDDEDRRLRRVHPFLFAIEDTSRIRFDCPNVQRRWVWPAEIDQLDTVPGLADALKRVLP